jgi:hypothetical protein
MLAFKLVIFFGAPKLLIFSIINRSVKFLVVVNNEVEHQNTSLEQTAILLPDV